MLTVSQCKSINIFVTVPDVTSDVSYYVIQEVATCPHDVCCCSKYPYRPHYPIIGVKIALSIVSFFVRILG